MRTPISILDNVKVSSPCSVRWESMAGDDRTRICSQCQLRVFNLSGMSRDEAEDLIRAKQGRLCVRYYQRADGTIMTSDCPKGVGRRLRRALAAAVGLFLSLVVAACAWAHWTSDRRSEQTGLRLRDREPFRTIHEWLDPSPPVVMGVLCPPPEEITIPEPPDGPVPDQVQEP
jgi:hypothetical protein